MTYYTEEHLWVRPDEATVWVGITEHAAVQLGDVVFVALPEVGAQLGKGAQLATIESVKTASDVHAPFAGEVVAVNAAVTQAPELLNEQPTGDGWLLRIQPASTADLAGLMDADAYRAMITD